MIRIPILTSKRSLTRPSEVSLLWQAVQSTIMPRGSFDRLGRFSIEVERFTHTNLHKWLITFACKNLKTLNRFKETNFHIFLKAKMQYTGRKYTIETTTTVVFLGCTESSILSVKPNLTKKNNGSWRPWVTYIWNFHYFQNIYFLLFIAKVWKIN